MREDNLVWYRTGNVGVVAGGFLLKGFEMVEDKQEHIFYLLEHMDDAIATSPKATSSAAKVLLAEFNKIDRSVLSQKNQANLAIALDYFERLSTDIKSCEDIRSCVLPSRWVYVRKSISEEIVDDLDKAFGMTDEAETTPDLDKRKVIMTEEVKKTTAVVDRRKVFVVHGRNLKARDAMFAFLRSIDLRPMEWTEARKLSGKTNPYVGEILDAAFSHAQAIVVLMTPDDLAHLHPLFVSAKDPAHEKEPTGQARPNVLFEAGMAMGRCPDRTVLVELGELRPFSDIGGRHVIRLTNDSQHRQELANRLVSANCTVDLSNLDWHKEGDFDGSLKAAPVETQRRSRSPRITIIPL